MATIQRAHQAQAIQNQMYTANQQAVAAIQRLKQLRDTLAGLPQGDRDEIAAAIDDLGFDSTETQAILGDWNSLHAEMVSLGIDELPAVDF